MEKLRDIYYMLGQIQNSVGALSKRDEVAMMFISIDDLIASNTLGDAIWMAE